MPFTCVLCEKETCYIANLCDKCRRIKHLISVYDDRVYKVLDNVLVRNEKAVLAKEKIEVTAEKSKIDNRLKAS